MILVRNNGSDPVVLDDLGGFTINGNAEVDLLTVFRLHEIASSDSLVSAVSSGTLTVSNGAVWLDSVSAIRLILGYQHLNPISPDGKEIVRPDTRPVGTTTYFTCVGDDQKVGDGKPLFWDFSTSDDLIAGTEAPPGHHNYIPPGFKRKRVVFHFSEPIYLKDGTIYFFNAKRGSYLDMYVVCPAGQFYLSRNGAPVLASVDTPVVRYVCHHMFYGDCPMGDELNAEGAQIEPVPPNYRIWADVTVPESDNDSFGFGSLELYRSRTYLLPDEWEA
ncbi:MAG: hypothetical protein QW835_00195 [Candidatus Hadarchaeum sp.]